MKKRPGGVWGVEIRSKYLDKGRLDLSLGVPVGASAGAPARDNKREAERREAAIRLMVERGEWQILTDLRAGLFAVVDLANAVRDGRVDQLRRVGEEPLALGSMVDRVLSVKGATQEMGTLQHYQKVTRSLLDHFGADADLTQITREHAEDWLYGRGREKPWSANTQAAYHMVAAYLWRSAIEMEMENAERLQARPRITRNVWDAVKPKGERVRRHSFLEPVEWATLLDVVQRRPPAALLALCCLAGLRVQEALHLRTGIDVDLSGRDPVIRVQPREGEISWKPKNDNSVREIPIFPALLTILQDHAERYAGDRYFLRSARADRPLSYTQAKRWAAEAFSAAGMTYGREGEGLTLHSLRHTFASWLVREGWSSTLVARWLGNTSREVERTYAHLQTTDLHKIGSAMQSLLTGGKDTGNPLTGPVESTKTA